MEGLGANPHFNSKITSFDEEDVTCHYQWLVNGCDIRLIQKLNKIFHEVSTLKEGVFLKGELHFPETIPINSVISAVKKQHVYMPSKETIHFCVSLGSVDLGTVELTLLLDEDVPRWQLFNKQTKKTEWQRFSAIFLSTHCHKETWSNFEDLKDERYFAENIQYFREHYHVVDVIRINGPFHMESNENVKPKKDEYDLQKKLDNETGKIKKLYKRKEYRRLTDLDSKCHQKEDFFIARKLLKYQNVTLTSEMVEYSGTAKGTIIEYESNCCFSGRYSFREYMSYPTFKYKKMVFKTVRKDRYELLSVKAKDQIKNKIKLLSKTPELSERIRSFLYKISPFYVVLEPNTTPSRIENSNALLSNFRWAVTLINNKGKCGQHAQVVVEGINDGFFPDKNVGEYLMYVAHLVGKDNLKHNFIEARDLKLSGRSEVWLRPADQIKAMILKIKEEVDSGKKDFCLLGSSFLFSGGNDNCTTWARKMLKIGGVNLKTPFFGFLLTGAKSYTKPLSYYKNKPAQKI